MLKHRDVALSVFLSRLQFWQLLACFWLECGPVFFLELVELVLIGWFLTVMTDPIVTALEGKQSLEWLQAVTFKVNHDGTLVSSVHTA